MNESRFGHFTVLILVLGCAVLGCAFSSLMTSCTSGTSSPVSSLASSVSGSITGTWGGDGVRLTIDQTGAVILFGCGGGFISDPLALDPEGRFESDGTFWFGGGADPVAGRPQRPARYFGFLKGATMKLTGTLLDTGESLGTYHLASGNAGTRVGICG